jgi:hypothetical protein
MLAGRCDQVHRHAPECVETESYEVRRRQVRRTSENAPRTRMNKPTMHLERHLYYFVTVL